MIRRSVKVLLVTVIVLLPSTRSGAVTSDNGQYHPFVLPAGHESQVQKLLGPHAHGAPLPGGWKLQSIVIRPKAIRCLFSRDDESYVMLLTWPDTSTESRSKNFRIEFSVPGGKLGDEVRQPLRSYLEDMVKRNDTGPNPWVMIRRSPSEGPGSSFWGVGRTQILLGIMALALLFMLGAAPTVVRLLRRVSGQDYLLLSSLVFFGAALRMAGGPRVPAWVNFHGNSLLSIMLGEPWRLHAEMDSHGNTFYAVHYLALSVFPTDLWTVLGVQLTLSLAVIPLTYAATRLWLHDTSGARWAAVIAAILPVPAYYGLTEAHMVPGTFFLLLALTVLGMSLRTGHPLLMFSAALWAVVTTQSYPTLMIVPAILLGFVACQAEGRALLRRPWIWAAGGVGLLLWLVPAVEYLRLLLHGEAGGVFGPDYLKGLRLSASIVPELGFSMRHAGNVFLNPSYTPPLFAIAAALAVWGAITQPGRRAQMLVVLASAVLLTMLHLLSGNMDGARIQLVAQPLYCMLAGVGLAWILTRAVEHFHGRLRLITAVLVLLVAASVAIWPGPIGRIFTPQAEARAFRAGVDHLPSGCYVISPFRVGRYEVNVPTYHLRHRGDLKFMRLPEGGQFPPDVRGASCVAYFRSTACFDRSHDPMEERGSLAPDGRISPCVAFEEPLDLKAIFVREIPARPDSRQIFTRSRIPVGFFRVRRWPPGK